MGSRVRPVASTVISCATGTWGTRYQTVRANEATPKQLGASGSGLDSTSSAIASCSCAAPLTVWYAVNAAAAAGESLAGGAARAGVGQSPIASSKASASEKLLGITAPEPAAGS